MTPITILHCADLHLGFPASGLSRQQNTQRLRDRRQTFLDIIRLCHQKDVQLLLIAGDLFDSWEVDWEEFQLVTEELSRLSDTTVAIVGGNHDPLTATSRYHTEQWPENVHIFPPEYQSIILESLGVELWGASFGGAYEHQSLLVPKAPQRPDLVQLGILHGTVVSAGGQSEYHPISVQQIEASGLSYLALGHIHKASGLQKAGETYYAYPGSPEALGFDEPGPRGVLVGQVSRHRCELEFYPVGQRQYLLPTIDISGISSSHQAAQRVLEQLERQQERQMTDHIYRISLTGELPESTALSLDTIKSLLEQELFYVSLADRTELAVDWQTLKEEPTLRGVFAKILWQQQAEHSPETVSLALTLGLRSFLGEVEYYED